MITRVPVANVLCKQVPLRSLVQAHYAVRHNSSQTAASRPTDVSSPVDPRWLSDIKTRVGKCITFGLSGDQLESARQILHQVAQDWRELLVGSEGFLTSQSRCGLHRHAVNWGDMDTMGHVNNVQYVRYAESGRCNWMRNFAIHIDPGNKKRWLDMASAKGTGLIMRSIKVDYKFPMTWPDRISVYHKFRSLPSETTDSLILDVLILSEARQRPAARALEDIVIYDYRKGIKTTLEPFMLEQFRKTFELQEEAKHTNIERVRTILADVRALEQSSWDRPDAKEDFGSAR